eukprot:gene4288-5363_t
MLSILLFPSQVEMVPQSSFHFNNNQTPQPNKQNPPYNHNFQQYFKQQKEKQQQQQKQQKQQKQQQNEPIYKTAEELLAESIFKHSTPPNPSQSPMSIFRKKIKSNFIRNHKDPIHKHQKSTSTSPSPPPQSCSSSFKSEEEPPQQQSSKLNQQPFVNTKSKKQINPGTLPDDVNDEISEIIRRNNRILNITTFLPLGPGDFINHRDPTRILNQFIPLNQKGNNPNNIILRGSNQTTPVGVQIPAEVLEGTIPDNRAPTLVFSNAENFIRTISSRNKPVYNSLLDEEDLSFANQTLIFISSVNGTDIPECGVNFTTPCKSIRYVTLLPWIRDIRLTKQISFFLLPGIYLAENVSISRYYQLNIIGLELDIEKASVRGAATIIGNNKTRNFFIRRSNVAIFDIDFKNNNIQSPFSRQGLDMRNLTFGSSISILQSNVVLYNTTFQNFYNNDALGTVFCYMSNLTMSTVIFKENLATSGGGLFCSSNSTCILNQVKFISNQAIHPVGGGAVVIDCSVAFLNMTLFVYNQASVGAAMVVDGGYVNTNYSTFNSNLANLGGAVYVAPNSLVWFYSCAFIYNQGISTGGAFFVGSSATVAISLSVFKFNRSIGTGIIETHTDRVLGIESCVLEGGLSILNSSSEISVSETNSFLIVRDSLFKNISSPVVRIGSPNVAFFLRTNFTDIFDKVINLYNNGIGVFVSSYIRNVTNTNRQPLISVSNKSQMLFYDMHFYNNSITVMMEVLFNSSVLMLDSDIRDNIIQRTFINGVFGFDIDIENTRFINNTGATAGAFIRSDQLGNIQMYNNEILNNTSKYGTILYFDTISETNQSCTRSIFVNQTMLDNFADFSGGLIYYSGDVLCNFTCIACNLQNNTSTLGEAINSSYYRFNASIPSSFVPSTNNFPIFITAYDALDNPYLGPSPVTFTVSVCPLFFLSGIPTTSLTSTGITVIYSIRISGYPGTVCNVTITSFSAPLTRLVQNYTVTVEQCPQGSEPFQIGPQNSYYCLHRKKAPTIAKIIVTTLAIIIIIIYSNPTFLYIILFGCTLSMGAIFMALDVTNILCVIKMVLIPISIVLVTSATIIKQYRIWRLIKSAHLLQESNVTNNDLLKKGSLMLVIPVLTITVSLIAIPFDRYFTYDLNDNVASYFCASTHYFIVFIVLAVYMLILLLFGCYIVIECRQFRNFPGTFNEFLYLGILIYVYTVILVIAIPLAFALYEKPLANYLVFTIPELLREMIKSQEEILVKNKILLKVGHRLYERDNNDNIIYHETFSSDESTYSPHSASSSTIKTPIFDADNLNLPDDPNNNNNNNNNNDGMKYYQLANFSSSSSSNRNPLLSPKSLSNVKRRIVSSAPSTPTFDTSKNKSTSVPKKTPSPPNSHHQSSSPFSPLPPTPPSS